MGASWIFINLFCIFNEKKEIYAEVTHNLTVNMGY